MAGRTTPKPPLIVETVPVTVDHAGLESRLVVASRVSPAAEAGQETSTLSLVRTMERRGGGLVQRYSLAPLSGNRQRVPAWTGLTCPAEPPVHKTVGGCGKRSRLSSKVKLRPRGHVLSAQTSEVCRQLFSHILFTELAGWREGQRPTGCRVFRGWPDSGPHHMDSPPATCARRCVAT